MAYKPVLTGYVKFLRGTTEAWNSLATKDGDTLYFISDNGSATGTLYLGSKLISGGSSQTAIPTNLGDLEDVLISQNIQPGSILIFNSTNQKWEPASLETVLANIVTVMTGATAEEDGAAGLVPAPQSADRYLYLRGDATWANPVAGVESALNTLIGSDTGQSVRAIAADEAASAVAEIVNNAPESFDTLKEIADWIGTHGTEAADLTTDVANLKDTVFGTENSQGLTTRVTTIEELLNGTQDPETKGLISTVNTLKTNFTEVNTRVIDLTDRMTAAEADIDVIDNRLKWQDLVLDETENNG